MNIKELSEQYLVEIYNNVKSNLVTALREKLAKTKKTSVDVDTLVGLLKDIEEASDIPSSVVVSSVKDTKDTKAPAKSKSVAVDKGDKCTHLLVRGDRKGDVCGVKANYTTDAGEPRCSKHNGSKKAPGDKSASETGSKSNAGNKKKGGKHSLVVGGNANINPNTDPLADESDLDDLVSELMQTNTQSQPAPSSVSNDNDVEDEIEDIDEDEDDAATPQF